MGYVANKGAGKGGWDPKKSLTSDIYHSDQSDKGNPMGQVPNKGVGKGVGSTKKRIKNDRYHDEEGEERNPME
jgi:hypothetical protein